MSRGCVAQFPVDDSSDSEGGFIHEHISRAKVIAEQLEWAIVIANEIQRDSSHQMVTCVLLSTVLCIPDAIPLLLWVYSLHFQEREDVFDCGMDRH